MVKKECFEKESEDINTNSNETLSLHFDNVSQNGQILLNGFNDHSIEQLNLNLNHTECEDDEQIVLEQSRIKLDYYEKGNDDLTVCLYTKSVLNESVIVDFEETAFNVKFHTNDLKFLSSFPSASSNTTFIWTLELKYAIKPEECSFKVNTVKIEIYLKKKESFKWDQLAIVKPKNVNGIEPKSSVYTVGADFNLQSTKTPSNVWIPATGEVGPPPAPPLPPITKPKFLEKPKEICSWMQSSVPLGVGYTGLDNLGNTCFMNSVIQCLSNTEELRDYFMSNHFKDDINENNPLGTGGSMAISFAVLLKHLWSGQHLSYSPSKLKSLMGEKISQFSGFAQQDAQEYMAFLLDSLHEDVNRIKIKPYIVNSQSSDDELQIPDEELANDFWKKYRMRNDSVVVDLFQGQYKSKLVCPVCTKVSITFDPFLYLSIPVPKTLLLLSVYFFSTDSSKKPTKFLVKIHSESKVKKLVQMIAVRTNVAVSNLQLIQVSNGTIEHYFLPENTIPKLDAKDMLLMFEVLRKDSEGEDICEFVVQQRLKVPQQTSNICSQCKCNPDGKLKRCTQCYRSSYCNQNCQKKDWNEHKKTCHYQPEPVGCPFLITLPRSKCTVKNLNQLSSEYSKHSVDVFHPESRTPNGDIDNCMENTTSNSSRKFVLRNLSRDVIADSDDIPSEIFFGDFQEKSYVTMEWMNNDKESLIVESKDLDHSYDILEAEKVQNEVVDISLEECLQMFTEPEVLTPQEAWYCPRCKEHREASKQLTLWRLPQILVVQLKRFAFKNLIFRDKIDKFINFPLSGLDLSDYCCGNSLIQEKPVYDLYGVINHYGGMYGGHYTAFAKTSLNGKQIDWRVFDDCRVNDMDEDYVVTKNAYILFYRLREDKNCSF
ncbi:hypothetical protein B4U80_07359 [Leptotrombidium deliense]|uniref:Ubiquitin carboxyl-terminal hydrolase n=1 Tax=Leptotrombidium deliense TaxID=299467 RepID=A0A443SCQ8_9ACAR|nr:hypothetical protein B4U80_07359 [Leptotrombidium deliense]